MIFTHEQTRLFSHQQHRRYYRLVKQNQLSFSSIEINKPLPAQVHSPSQIRFKFRSQFQLLPQISSISTDSNITDNIIRKVINVQQKKCRTKNRALRNSSIRLGYIKCYRLSSPRPVKSPGNSIRYNCQKICGSSRTPKNILEIKKRPNFSR